MAIRAKPIPLGDLKDLPFTLQEWIRTVSVGLFTPTGAIPVSSGGTGLTSGTDGGILGFTGTTTLASSVLLTNHALVLGGGAGATPTPLGSLGTATTVLHGNATGAPSFSAVSLTADITGTLQVPHGGTGITSGTSGGIPFFDSTNTLASSLVLGSAAIMVGGGAGVRPSTIASLGTTTTVLHGNAAGVPSWGAVSLTDDVSGVVPLLNGGTAVANSTAASGTFLRGNATGFATSTLTLPNALTTTQVLYGTGTNAVGSSANLTFDGTKLGIGVTGTPLRNFQIASDGLLVGIQETVGADFITLLLSDGSGNPLLRMFNSGIVDAQIIAGSIDATNKGFLINCPIKVTGSIFTSGNFSAVGLASKSSTVADSLAVTAGGSLMLRPANGSAAYITFLENGRAFTGAFGFTAGSDDLVYKFGGSGVWDGTEKWRWGGSGAFGLGNTGALPTAYLHLKAGTATASTAPIKLTSGTLLTTAEAGGIEFLTDKAYFTITTGAVRKELALNDSALVSGNLIEATTNGRLQNATTTGTGNAVRATSPTFVTPILGDAQATSINFGGTSLSNYVEATFTPTVLSGGAATGRTYTTQRGSYTRVGNTVHFRVNVQLSAKGSSTGATTIPLPLTGTSAVNHVNLCTIASENVTFANPLFAYILGSSPTVLNVGMFQSGGGSATLQDTALVNTSGFYITGSYEV